MRHYRGLKNPYRPERVDTCRVGGGTDFTNCPAVALLYAQEARGVLLVVDVDPEQQLATAKLTEEFWLVRNAKRFMLWDASTSSSPPSCPRRISGLTYASAAFATHRTRARRHRSAASSPASFVTSRHGRRARGDPTAAPRRSLADRGIPAQDRRTRTAAVPFRPMKQERDRAGRARKPVPAASASKRARAARARRPPQEILEDHETPAARRIVLDRMQAAWMTFYRGAASIGCHAFLEFSGLMATFIDSCREAETNGTPWLRANVHHGVHLPLPEHRLDYLREKLECIYGTKFQVAAR